MNDKVEHVTNELAVPEDDVTKHSNGSVSFYVPDVERAEALLDEELTVLEQYENETLVRFGGTGAI